MPAQLRQGNMIDYIADCDHFIVCAGSHCRAENGELVMMRGLSYQLAQKLPQAPAGFGKAVANAVDGGGNYYLLCNNKFGLFQLYYTTKETSNMLLASHASTRLKELAEANPGKKYFLEAMWDKDPKFLFEGILRKLPENVTVWHP